MRRWVTSPAYRVVVDALVQARVRQGRTQRWLAERLSKPPSYVAKIEVGERRVDIVEVVAVARALGVDVPGLLVEIAAALPDELDV